MSALTASVAASLTAPRPDEPRRPLAGTRLVLAFVLRRDRIRLPVWLLGLIVLTWFGSDAVWDLYRTPEQIQQYVDSVQGNPAVVMFAGPGYGFDDPNIGTILVNEMSIWMAVACALMSIFLVVRHTRAEEDTGTADLVRAQPVGRYAAITSATAEAVAANTVVFVASVLALVVIGFDAEGSIALSASYSLFGMLFAGVAALTAQLGSSARAALGLASAVLAASFVLRGIGDINESWLTWASPMGWAIGVRAFADERWWTLALLAALAAATLATAYVLADRRDLGSGILRVRPGSPEAPGWLGSPLAMAWRQQRVAVAAWAFGLFVMGLLFGSVSDAIESMIETNPELAEMIAQVDGASITDSFVAYTLSILALIVGGFAVSSVLRLRSDETAGHTELVLATPTSRSSLCVGTLVVSVVGSLVVTLAGGVGLALGNLLVLGDEDEVVRLVGASLGQAPAVLVFVGLGMAVFGWLPRLTAAAWAAFAAVLTIGIFGDLFDLPDWATSWSPFTMLPLLPAEEFEWAPTLGLLAAGGALAAAGVVGFVRRDLEP